MKLSHSERRTLSLVGAALVAILTYFYGVKPLLESGGYDRDGPDHTVEMERARGLMAGASAIRDRHERLSQALAKVESSYLPDDDADRGGISLLALVERIAEGAGIAVRARGIGQALGENSLTKIAVEITGEGDPRAVTGFLQGIWASRYRLEVKSLELVAGEDRRLQLRTVVETILPRVEEERDNDRTGTG